MRTTLGSVLALAYALTLVNAENIILNHNGCPVSPNHEKLLPHENCNQFYQCVNGRRVLRDCPEGLFYNEKKLMCDWPDNVICKHALYSGIHIKHTDNKDHNEVPNSNPSEAPFICSAAGSEGVLVAHENCNQFYKCSNGVPVPMICPVNLLYNPTGEACDWANNVECNGRIIPDDSGNEDHEDESDDSEKNEDDEDDIITNCDPNEAPAICLKDHSDGVLIAHEICNKFYKCSFGQPVSLDCPSGLLYNSKKEYCDWPDNVYCGERLIPEDDNNEGSGNEYEGNTNCDPSEAPAICAKEDSDGVLVAHENCDQFYKCSERLPVALNCPSGLLYNSKKEQCDWPQNVKCDDRIIPAEKDTPGNYDPSKAPEICANENSNGILVAHEKCNQYYMCANGIPVNQPCPNGLFFNPSKNVCDWLQNVNCDQRTIPEENDHSGDNKNYYKKPTSTSYTTLASIICTKEDSDSILLAHDKCNHFYECAQGKPVAFKCPSNLLYNPKYSKCDWPENVECGHRVIPEEKDDIETEDKEQNEVDKVHEGYSDPSEAPYICAKEGSDSTLIAHEKCDHYYVCWNGKPVAMRCPEILFYDPISGRCDWPSNVKCNKITV